MRIVIASNNKHKINEIKEVLPARISLISLEDIGIKGDIPENEDSLEANALAKARYVYKLSGLNVFADDTGLEVKCLGNRPGVHSARYAGEGRNPDDNMNLLLKEMSKCPDRSARFRTIIALIFNKEEYIFEGIVNGKIAEQKSGSEGFGYDPLFIPDSYSLTFAEMSINKKNSISHRARAIRKLCTFLNKIEQ